MKISPFTLLLCCVLSMASCQRDKDTQPTNPELSNQEIQNKILNDFSIGVALATYKDMETKMNAFNSACIQFDASQSQTDLVAARNTWKNVRAVWEQSEAFLFGPVSTDNIDSGTDTWPIDHNSLDSLLTSANTFTQSYMNNLGDALKGYHPSEYLLWGSGGNKVPGDFMAKEREYLIALAADLFAKTSSLRSSWDPTVMDNYSDQVIQAGLGNSVYPSQRAVFDEMVNGMIGICDEVANGKIFEPFSGLDPSLEESPYSKNSVTDFKNNIQGVKNVYFGDFMSDGYGLSNFMMKNNLSIHASVASRIENALNSFNGITVPFGEAIISQRAQVQNVINQINALKISMEDQLLPFIQQTITE